MKKILNDYFYSVVHDDFLKCESISTLAGLSSKMFPQSYATENVQISTMGETTASQDCVLRIISLTGMYCS